MGVAVALLVCVVAESVALGVVLMRQRRDDERFSQLCDNVQELEYRFSMHAGLDGLTRDGQDG